MMLINFKKSALITTAVFFLLILTISFLGKGPDEEQVAPVNNSSSQAVSHNDILLESEEKETDSDFFAEYRMERERIRGKQVEMLREIINNDTHEKQAREAASLRLVKITEDMEKEMKAETLVKSKGFAECVVIIQPETVTVVLKASTLRLDKETELKDLLSSLIQCNEEKICIIEKE